MAIRGYDRAYNELYVNNAMVTLATMLDYAVNSNHENIDVIFKKFIDSGYNSIFEKGDPAIITGKSGVELYNLIKYNGYGNCYNLPYCSFNRSPEYWLGWSLAYYQWYTITSFRDIHKQISLSEMLTWYNTLHEADLSRFVEMLDSRLYVKQTNLEYFRKRAGLSQDGLSQLSGVPKHSIQLYEQRQHDISKAQFNILYAIARVLNCSVYDLSEQTNYIITDNYNTQYSQDNFINQLTHRIEENNRYLAQLQTERAQIALQQQGYAFGYAGQFPYQQLQFNNPYYQIPKQTFTDNWGNYWNHVLTQRQAISAEYDELRKQIAKYGIDAIGKTAKETNRPIISMAADAIGILTADNLADAIQKTISLLGTATRLK